MKIDGIDKTIIKMLVNDARTPVLSIARKVGVSGAAIHQRLKKLEKSKLIGGYKLIVNPKSLGYTTTAFVGLIHKYINMFAFKKVCGSTIKEALVPGSKGYSSGGESKIPARKMSETKAPAYPGNGKFIKIQKLRHRKRMEILDTSSSSSSPSDYEVALPLPTTFYILLSFRQDDEHEPEDLVGKEQNDPEEQEEEDDDEEDDNTKDSFIEEEVLAEDCVAKADTSKE